MVESQGARQWERRVRDGWYWPHDLFDQALLAEGGQLADPAGFVGRLNGLLCLVASGR